MAIKFINNEKEMTTLEARETYKGFYIGFVVTKQTAKSTGFDNWLGKVLYIAETYKEQYEIPVRTEGGQRISLQYGTGVKDLPMGGVIVDTK